MGVSEHSVRLAREDWRSGERAVERLLADPARAPVALRVLKELDRELRHRLGQTYTLAALVALYDDADRCGPVAPHSASPRTSAGPRTGVFAEAACARAARRARDWTPA